MSGKTGQVTDADWAKYGLLKGEGGEQTNLESAVPTNDLYLEEQQSATAKPWWKLSLFVHEPVLFGTWDGVFTSVVINIFGVIIFLRTGWMIANAGIAEAVLILLLSVVLVLVPVLSAVGICERCQIQSGGVYFLVSHILGGQIGAAVGVIYTLGQTMACAFVAIGFGESMTDLMGTENIWAIRGFAVGITLLLTGINVAGVKWVVKVQLALLLILVLGMLDYTIGTFVTYNPEVGVTGYSEFNFRNNTDANYQNGENFFSVFGVYFSTFTGVLSGVNMSGDLKDPSKSIPLGELTALLLSSIISLLFILSLGSTCSRDYLLMNPLIAEKVSWLKVPFLMGLYISSLSSILGSLYGAPRILQSIASENVIPFMKRLETGRGPNKVPVLGIIVILTISIALIMVGQLNILAKIATMPYLMTYAFINYSYVSLAMSYDIQQQRIVSEAAGRSARYGSMTKLPSELPTAKGDSSDLEKLIPPGKGSQKGTEEDEKPIDGLDDAEMFAASHQPCIIHQPTSWYSIFCNRWIALVGVVVNLTIIFLVHWGFALGHILLFALIYVYVGQVNPGVFSGISEFNIPTCLKTIFNRCCRRTEYDNDKIVVTPLHPGVKTFASRLTDDNADYSARSPHHQSRTEQLDDFD